MKCKFLINKKFTTYKKDVMNIIFIIQTVCAMKRDWGWRKK